MANIDDCKYNKMVECAPVGRVCSLCSWNPAVKEKRAKRLRIQMSEAAKKNKED